MTLFFFSQRTVLETKGWDVFQDPPIKHDSGSMANQECLQITVKITKALAYLITFVIVLVSGVVSKGTLLFMTSQVNPDQVLPYCNRELGKYFCIITFKIIIIHTNVNKKHRNVVFYILKHL